MSMLIKLEKAIRELELQKNELLEKIQDCGWKDDREKRIPAKSTLDTDIDTLLVDPEKRAIPPDANSIYQRWYCAGKTILEKNQPSRLREFEDAYLPVGKNPVAGIKQLLNKRHLSKEEQFSLMDILNVQFEILAAVPTHLRYSIYDIELTVSSVLMGDEISASQHLLKKGFLRAAGVLAGVVLERHLKTLLKKHTTPVKFKEKDTLSQLNELCKETVYDQVTWRKVQHLTDLRNLCGHDKLREPTKDEVTELIKGVFVIVRTSQ